VVRRSPAEQAERPGTDLPLLPFALRRGLVEFLNPHKQSFGRVPIRTDSSRELEVVNLEPVANLVKGSV
jgi:hypothetical protein